MRRAIVLMAVIGALAGCSSTVEQADGSKIQFKWLKGELETALAYSLPAAFEATRTAFGELGFAAVDGTMDRLDGRLWGSMADGSEVQVRLKAAGTDHTFIRIKVGNTGDRSTSLEILHHIEAALEN